MSEKTNPKKKEHSQEEIDNALRSFTHKLKTSDPQPLTSNEIANQAKSFGWRPLGQEITYSDKSHGITVEADNDPYENGIYIWHQMNPDEHGRMHNVLEVVIPNNIDKSNLIKTLVDNITTHIDGLDTSDINPFDYNQIFAYVIANTVVKPLAKEMFPDDLVKQARFRTLYMTRFLSDTANYYAGSDDIYEEQINASPYVIKKLIDQYTDKELEKQAKDAQREAIEKAKKLRKNNDNQKEDK